MVDLDYRLKKIKRVVAEWLKEAQTIYERFYGENMPRLEPQFSVLWEDVGAQLTINREGEDKTFAIINIGKNGLVQGSFYLWDSYMLKISFIYGSKKVVNGCRHSILPHYLAPHIIAHLTFLNFRCWQDKQPLFSLIVYKEKDNVLAIDFGSWNYELPMCFCIQYPIEGSPYFHFKAIYDYSEEPLEFRISDADGVCATIANCYSFSNLVSL